MSIDNSSLNFSTDGVYIWTEDVKTGRIFVVVVVLLDERYYSICVCWFGWPSSQWKFDDIQGQHCWIRGCEYVLGAVRKRTEVWSDARVIGYIWLFSLSEFTLIQTSSSLLLEYPTQNFWLHIGIPSSIFYLLYTLSLLDIALCCSC